jgi:hypothetical protein
MAKKAPAIALKDIMYAVDKKDKHYYNNLTDEQKKAFSAWMMMRYASSVQGTAQVKSHYIYMVNELVNKHFSDISSHPELQWLLLSACGVGSVQYHPYLKPPNGRKKKNKVGEFISKLYPHYKSDEIDLFMKLNSKDELKQLATDSGYSDKEIKEIFGK